MHYFKRNIGEYHKKAGKLSMLEHGAYTLLIDACYDREKFPTLEEAIDWTWARTAEEIAAVEFVLRKFFTLEDGVYIQNRIREEIDQYHANALINQEIALKREAKKREQRARTVHEPSTLEHERAPKQEPLTTNHKPITNNQELKTYCSEPIVSEPEDPPVIEILTNKKNELAKITHSQYDRWVETYPAVDVWQTLLRIKSWAEANPAKRKTNKGMARFIDSWLAREQDKPRVNPGGSGTPQTQFKNSREKNAERNAQIFDYNRAIDF